MKSIKCEILFRAEVKISAQKEIFLLWSKFAENFSTYQKQLEIDVCEGLFDNSEFYIFAVAEKSGVPSQRVPPCIIFAVHV